MDLLSAEKRIEIRFSEVDMMGVVWHGAYAKYLEDAREAFGLSNRMTARSLEAIGKVGGPRCCKRDSYLSILAAIDFVKEQFGVEMEKPEVICGFSGQNRQCLGKGCPFSRANHPAG